MPVLRGIVEMDETYIGGKPRYKGISKRGRGTNKMPVVGAVERDGRVVAEPLTKSKTNAFALRDFIIRNVDRANTLLMSDDFRGYRQMRNFVSQHDIINHHYEYVRGDIHTNTIEGFWANLKRAHYGQHHHYTRRYSHLYIGEACFKYNNREAINRKESEGVFDELTKALLCTHS